MLDVLAVGPHPDDVELAAGGTLARWIAAGHSVRLLDLTRGERATRGTPEDRAREAAEAARRLGTARDCLNLPDGKVDARDPAQVNALVTVFRARRPRLVLTLSGHDDHPDHREGAELVTRAAYLSGLANHTLPGSADPPYRPGRVLFGMGRRAFVPKLVVDVSAVYETKRALLAAYVSQFSREPGDSRITPISDPGFLAAREARDRHFGSLIGAAFGEPFTLEGPVPLEGPGALLSGGRP